MNTLRIGLFFILLLTGCGGSPELSRLKRLAGYINSKEDVERMNKSHDDYYFIPYSILTDPKTSKFIYCGLGYSYYSPALTQLPIGATYKDSLHNGLFKVIGRRETTFYTGQALSFAAGPHIDHKADSIKEYFRKKFAEDVTYYSIHQGMSKERATFGNGGNAWDGKEYFFADETNAKLIEEMRNHKVGDIFTFSDEPGARFGLHRIIKKLNNSGPAIETIVVKIEKYMDADPL